MITEIKIQKSIWITCKRKTDTKQKDVIYDLFLSPHCTNFLHIMQTLAYFRQTG